MDAAVQSRSIDVCLWLLPLVGKVYKIQHMHRLILLNSTKFSVLTHPVPRSVGEGLWSCTPEDLNLDVLLLVPSLCAGKSVEPNH